jgi:integrase
MSQAKRTPSPGKPKKPYPDFPLFPHATKRWAKKIRGRMCYFGPWDDPEGALRKYLDQKDDLQAGRLPRESGQLFTLGKLCNRILHDKRALVDSSELSIRTWQEYKNACDLLTKHFGPFRAVSDLRPEEFTTLRQQMSERWGLYRLGNSVMFVRSIFKYAFEENHIPAPVRFGSGFKGPSKRAMRLARAAAGPKLFSREEIRRLLKVAEMPLRAMILLGLNAAYGNNDCGRLPLSAVDLERGVVDFARPKTGAPRRCTLWPETVAALRKAIAERPEPLRSEHSGLVFLTSRGYSWAKDVAENPISKKFAKLLRELQINGRKNLGFYTLRHVFRTIADETRDQPACDLIMGHESGHISAHYRETISDVRLKAITDHVRSWLFPKPAKRQRPKKVAGNPDVLSFPA